MTVAEIRQDDRQHDNVKMTVAEIRQDDRQHDS